MATDLPILLLLVLTFCFSTSSALNSRKGLRTKEVNKEDVIQLGRSIPPNIIDPSRVTELSWQPRVFLYRGFLSNEECDHLMSLGTTDNKEKSVGSTEKSERTKELTINSDISIDTEDEITARIEERISAWTFLPKGSGKSFHVLHFGSEEAKQNHNYFGDTPIQLTGESVLATVVLYLTNVTHGGHILFPEAESGGTQLKDKIWSDCEKNSQILRPTRGNAVLFFNLHPDASLDTSSTHARCPIVEGDMWWATKIFVVKSVVKEKLIVSETDETCTDEDDNCRRWAAIGECERNPVFMIGSSDYYGTCRKSCNVC